MVNCFSILLVTQRKSPGDFLEHSLCCTPNTNLPASPTCLFLSKAPVDMLLHFNISSLLNHCADTGCPAFTFHLNCLERRAPSEALGMTQAMPHPWPPFSCFHSLYLQMTRLAGNPEPNLRSLSLPLVSSRHSSCLPSTTWLYSPFLISLAVFFLSCHSLV